jgi:hypothetical protein
MAKYGQIDGVDILNRASETADGPLSGGNAWID